MSHLLCLGFGYTASALAQRLAGTGWRVTGTSTSSAGAQRIAGLGHDGVVFDGTEASPALAAAIAQATHVVVSIPPGADGDPALARLGEALARAPHVSWVGYLSTIGVYGDQGGAWIDETAPLNPQSERARRRVRAEAGWQALGEARGAAVQVFRLPGIYGPGRSAIDALREGSARRIVKPGQVFNRIHVADIALTLATAMLGRGRHATYNVTDDEPAPPQDVVAYAAGLLGVAPPPEIPFAEAELSPMGASFYAENKRVSNARLKQDLGVTLRFPNYREGLRDCLPNRPAPTY